MIAHVLWPCANAEQISPPALEEQSSTAPNLALPGVPGCLLSPKTSLDIAAASLRALFPAAGTMPGSPAASYLCCKSESCSAELQEETGR